MDSVEQTRKRVAKSAARWAGVVLSNQEIMDAAEGEAKFLGHHRAEEIKQIANDLARWPSFGSIEFKKKRIYEHEVHMAVWSHQY